MELSAVDKLVQSENPAERRQAASLLAEMNGEDVLDRLEKLVVDPNQGVREVAQDTFIFHGGREAVKRIAPLVGSADAGIRNTAIEILRKIGEDGLDIMHELSGNPDERLRIFIVDILGSIGNHDSVEPLIQCLFDENANVRNQAVISLGTIGDVRAFEHLKEMINDEEWIRFSVIEALAKIPHEDVVDFLVSELKRWSNDEITMSAILETLGSIPSQKAIEPLLAMIRITDKYIQLAMVNTLLRQIPDLNELEEADREILKCIMDENLREVDEELLDSMLKALGAIGDRASIDSIINLAKDIDPEIKSDLWDHIRTTLRGIGIREAMVELLDREEEKFQILGAEILAGIAGEDDVHALIQRVDETSGYVKRAYVQALSQIGSPLCKDVLKEMMFDADGHVASYAIRAVGYLGTSADIMILKTLLSHTYEDVRDTVLKAIVHIGTQSAQECFMDLLEHTSPVQRVLGLRGLAEMSDAALPEILPRYLKDPDESVRLNAAQIALQSGVPLDADVLKNMLQDECTDVGFVAIDMVGIYKEASLRGSINDFVRSDDKWVAFHAIEAIGKFRDDDAKALLLSILAEGEDFLRIAAIKALGDWGDESLADELEIYAEDKNLDIARAVSMAVDKLRGLNF